MAFSFRCVPYVRAGEKWDCDTEWFTFTVPQVIAEASPVCPSSCSFRRIACARVDALYVFVHSQRLEAPKAPLLCQDIEWTHNVMPTVIHPCPLAFVFLGR